MADQPTASPTAGAYDVPPTRELKRERKALLVAIEARVQEIDALLDGTARIRRGGGGAVCICGAPILLGARFCASCGRSLAPGSAESRQAGSDAPG